MEEYFIDILFRVIANLLSELIKFYIKKISILLAIKWKEWFKR